MKILNVSNNGIIEMELTEEENRLLISYAVTDILRKAIKKWESEDDQPAED